MLKHIGDLIHAAPSLLCKEGVSFLPSLRLWREGGRAKQ